MKLLCKPTSLNEVVLRKSQEKILQNVELSQHRSAINPNSTPEERVPSVSTQSFDNNATEMESFMLHHSSHTFDIKIQQCAFLSTTNIIMELAHESSNSLKHKRPKLERGMQRECMVSHIPVGWKGKKLLAAFYRQICTAGSVLPFSAGSRTLLFREGRSRFVFLWEKIDPLPFQEKASGKP